MSEIQIALNKVVRSATAVLAASNWPKIEQELKPHAVHSHSKQTCVFTTPFAKQPAVAFINEGLASGQKVDELLTTLLNERSELLTQFEDATNVNNLFWPAHDDVWQTAVSECKQIFQNCPLPNLLAQMGGSTKSIHLMPTLVYPMLDPAVIAFTAYDLTLLPPPKAWGESPPWPYKEDPIWVVVEASKAILLNGLQPIFKDTAVSEQLKIVQAGVAVCLAKMFDDFESQAYIVRVKKEHQIKTLPQITARLNAWLESGSEKLVTDILEE